MGLTITSLAVDWRIVAQFREIRGTSGPKPTAGPIIIVVSGSHEAWTGNLKTSGLVDSTLSPLRVTRIHCGDLGRIRNYPIDY